MFFGWLSDRIGRLKIILAGCLVAVLTYFPLFQGLTHYVNPALETYAAKTPISVASSPAECNFHMFVGPWSTFTDCDRAKDFLTKQGLSFKSTDAVPGEKLVVKIGDKELKGAWDEKAATAALKDTGYPGPADKNKINYGMTLLILFIMLIYVTMVYGPIAAFLVELFPTRAPRRCRRITSATAGSAACCRCWPPPWWPPRRYLLRPVYPIIVA